MIYLHSVFARSNRRLLTGLLLASVTWFGLPARSFAEKPVGDPKKVKELERQLSLMSSDIGDMRKGGDVSNKESLVKYYDLLIQIGVSPVKEAKLPLFRDRIKKELKEAGNVQPPTFHEESRKYLLEKMQQLANDKDVKPIIRINAVLILGDLNSKELPPGGNAVATPWAQVLPVLLNMYRNHPDDAVRVVAQYGILRHAEGAKSGNLSKDMQTQLIGEMLKTLVTKDPPPGRTPDAQIWFRRRAIDVLGAIGVPAHDGDETAVLRALATVIATGEDARLLPLRLDAVKAVSRLQLKASQGINFSRLAESLGLLALEASRDPATETQRGLRYYATPIREALEGTIIPARVGVANDPEKPRQPGGLIALTTGSPHEEYVKNLAEKFNPLFDLAVNPKIDTDEYFEKAEALGDELENWLNENKADGDVVAAK